MGRRNERYEDFSTNSLPMKDQSTKDLKRNGDVDGESATELAAVTVVNKFAARNNVLSPTSFDFARLYFCMCLTC